MNMSIKLFAVVLVLVIARADETCKRNKISIISYKIVLIIAITGLQKYKRNIHQMEDRKHQLYPDDPLWDGEGCGGDEGPCCNVPGIPWFHKVLPSPTTDYIELRVCADQGTGDEDTPVSLYEIYVK